MKLPHKHLKEDGYNDKFEMMYEFGIYSGKALQTDAQNPVKLDDEYIGKCQAELSCMRAVFSAFDVARVMIFHLEYLSRKS